MRAFNCHTTHTSVTLIGLLIKAIVTEADDVANLRLDFCSALKHILQPDV